MYLLPVMFAGTFVNYQIIKRLRSLKSHVSYQRYAFRYPWISCIVSNVCVPLYPWISCIISMVCFPLSLNIMYCIKRLRSVILESHVLYQTFASPYPWNFMYRIKGLLLLSLKSYIKWFFPQDFFVLIYILNKNSH